MQEPVPFCLKSICLVFSVFLLSSVLFLSSCVHSHGKEPLSIEVLPGKEFSSYNDKNLSNNIFVSVQGVSQSRKLAQDIESQLLQKGFVLKDNPSSADLILQISVVYAGGAHLSDLTRAVESGYDAKVSVHGNEVSGLLVDALLVARAVPEAKNTKQQKLKNISQRQALGSSTTRFALYTQDTYVMRGLVRGMSEALAREICRKVYSSRKK